MSAPGLPMPTAPHLPPSPGRNARRAWRVALLSVLCGWVLWGCGGGDGPTDTPPPPPPAVAAVQFVGAPPSTLEVGQSVQLQARALDSAGAVLSGRPVTWTSSAPTVASVSGTGLVMALAPGQTTLTAASEGRSATAELAVVPPPVASVTLTPELLEILAGASGELTATLRSAGGAELSGRAVTWSSADLQVATVSDGVVTGVSAGETLVTATSEGVVGTAMVRVVSATAPRILEVVPELLVEGETAIVRGERFDPTPAGNQVRLGETALQVLSASATELELRIPEGTCVPEGFLPLRVQVGSEEARRDLRYRPQAFAEIPVGELRVFRGDALACVQLPATAEAGDWLVGVQSVSESVALRTPARVELVTGSDAEGSSAPFAAAWPQRPAPARAFGGGEATIRDAEALRHREAHMTSLEAQFRLLDDLRTAVNEAPMQAPLQAPMEPAIPATVQVGDTVQLNVHVGPLPTACSAQPQPSTMVVEVVSQRAVVVVDLANPAGGFSQAELQQFADFVDTSMYAIKEETFGTFTDLDGNGRLVIVVSKRVNDRNDFAGFVLSADFFPKSVCPMSNQGEYFYIVAPEVGAPPLSFRNKERALVQFPSLLTHETVHVIQFGRRIQAGSGGQITPWWSEGQATLGEEVVAREVLGQSAGSNLGAQEVWGTPPAPGTIWYRQFFFDLGAYYGFESAASRRAGAPEGCGWLTRGVNGECLSNRLSYGVGWSFLRWVTDHLADRVGGEAAFHRSLVDAPVQTMSTIGTLVGEDHRDLLAYWAATLYTDDRFEGLETRLTLPSWNLAEIETGLQPTSRLAPYDHGFSPFQRDLTVAAGASAYLRIEGASQPGTALSVKGGGGGGGVPESLQLWVVRLR
jgi:hypothetical protein